MNGFLHRRFCSPGIRVLILSVVAFAVRWPLKAQNAQIEHFVAPSYPALARQAMISGQVVLRLEVSPDGAIAAVSEESAAHPLLAQYAKAAVQDWKFQGAQRERRISVVVYYAFSGFTRESNPTTSIKADFAGSTVRVYVTTDGMPTVRP